MAKELDMAKFKKILLDERERLELEKRVQQGDIADNNPELSDYDNHPAEQATETYHRTLDYAISENIDEMIDQIDEALRKIEHGTYGKCDRCERMINPDRLRAIPYATLCIDCQDTLERR